MPADTGKPYQDNCGAQVFINIKMLIRLFIIWLQFFREATERRSRPYRPECPGIPQDVLCVSVLGGNTYNWCQD